MTVTASEVVEAVSELGLYLTERISSESIQWEVQLGGRICVVIELKESGERLTAISSHTIDLRRLGFQSQYRLMMDTLRHNAQLKIGHYELSLNQVRFRADLLVAGNSVSRDLIDRWLQTVIAQSCLFRLEGIPN